MLSKWYKTFTNNCSVIELPNNEIVYPIFKNGYTSLRMFSFQNQCKVYSNSDLNKLKEITVFLRNPIERFLSGVNTVIEMENILDIPSFLKDINEFKFIDRHFVPQICWLFHLSKYYKGDIKLRSVKELFDIIPNRNSPGFPKITNERKNLILSINTNRYTEIDQLLQKKYLNSTVSIVTVTKEFKNVLSSF